MLKGLQALLRLGDVKILKNKFSNPTPMGYRRHDTDVCNDSAITTSHRYRDFNLVLAVTLPRLTLKHLAEVQVNLESMLAAKRKAHVYYEKVLRKLCVCGSCSRERASVVLSSPFVSRSAADCPICVKDAALRPRSWRGT
jgi:hypothetical protein